jgi:predicted Zn-dependent protease
MLWRKTSFVSALMLSLTACTTGSSIEDQPVGAAPAIDTDEAGLWVEMGRIERSYATSALRLKDLELESYVKGVVCRLSESYCADLRVYIFEQPYFNAAMWPNGMMAVWTGLLLRAENEAQLAFVLGHEMGHYVRRHSLQRMIEIRNQGDILAFVNLGLAVAGLGSAGYLTTAFVVANLMSFSRENEREADELGVEYAINADYDPGEGAALWRLVKEEEAALQRDGPSIFFATHPAIDERISNIERHITSAGEVDPKIEQGRERYQGVMMKHRLDWLRGELRKGEYKGSQVIIDRLLASEPNSAALRFFQGELYRLEEQEGYHDNAVASYQKAIELGEPPHETYRELGLLYWDGDQFLEAQEAFYRYLAESPEATDRLMIEYYILELDKKASS